jgi:hypothetical protein
MTGRTDPRECQEERQDGSAREPCSLLSTWAAEQAAALPPLTGSQATAVGRIATQLDARMDHEQAA